MVLTALPKSFYKSSLDKVKTFAEKQSLTIRSVLTDQMVSALGRQERLEHGTKPDWDGLKSQVTEFIATLKDLQVRETLADKFGLRNQDQILAQFGSNRSRKQSSAADYRPAATFRTGGSENLEPDDDLDDDEDFE